MAAGFFAKIKNFFGKIALGLTKVIQNPVLNAISNAALPGLGTVSNKIGSALQSVLNNGGIT